MGKRNLSKLTLWTIGHSTRSFDNFLELLRENEIEAVADVRSLPGSRKFPQFNSESLQIALEDAGIEYVLIKKLGGRRRGKPDSPHTVWRHNQEGLYLTAGLAIAFVLFFDLGPIAMMGSAAFLLVYAAVNVAHLRVYHETGAQPALIALSTLACLAMFALLCVYIVQLGTLAPLVAPGALLALSFGAEWVYRRRTGRKLQPRIV